MDRRNFLQRGLTATAVATAVGNVFAGNEQATPASSNQRISSQPSNETMLHTMVCLATMQERICRANKIHA
jgi:hypothetical protein